MGILSPYIFVLVMEYWSISMDIALASGLISPIRRGPHNYVTHLLFVDDMCWSLLKLTNHHSKKLMTCYAIWNQILG